MIGSAAPQSPNNYRNEIILQGQPSSVNTQCVRKKELREKGILYLCHLSSLPNDNHFLHHQSHLIISFTFNHNLVIFSSKIIIKGYFFQLYSHFVGISFIFNQNRFIFHLHLQSMAISFIFNHSPQLFVSSLTTFELFFYLQSKSRFFFHVQSSSVPFTVSVGFLTILK